MAQDLKPGSRWVSAVCDTEVVVVKRGGDGVVIGCGGREMIPHGAEKPAGLQLDPGLSDGTVIGKRFEHESGVEVLCTKAGAGTLTANGTAMSVKESKPLPSSD